ncbi:MAG TPA: YbjQ family protein [Gemmatimonadales bacterium]|nr:YbjQ family protein [Gemmatimonadales bacterium]
MTKPVRYDGPKIVHHMTSTAFTLEGYTTVQTLGVVMGVTVRSRSVIGLMGATFQTFFGGRIANFVSLCEKARQEAFELMIEHAEQTGGNAIVGIRYDANEVMQGVTEVLCYGTAVVVEAAS